MDLIEYALPGEWISALGWTVLHSFWQAAIIALIVGVLLYRMQQQPSWRRYWVAHLGWFSIILCAVITFLTYYHPQEFTDPETITRLTPEGEAALLASPSFLGSFLHILAEYFNQHLPLIVSLWALGMVFFLLRFLGGLIFLQHLRSHRVQPLSADWEAKVKTISRQLHLRRPVQLLESALVKVPMVIGWMKPAILLPIGALNALSPQQVEAILAHELAHIKRHDYLLNLIRSLVEVLFYFNPAVWWLSAQIRTEREHCCDDMALEVCGDSLSYVRALVALQELSQRPGIGLAMTFVRSKPELLNRVRRILNQPKDKSDLMEKLIITCLLLLTLSFTLVSAGVPEELPPDPEPATPEIEHELYFNVDTDYEPSLHLETEVSTHLIFETLKGDHSVEVILDTIPRTGTTHLQMTRDGKSYDVRIRNNKIQRLSINGNDIPENELVNYYDEVQELLDDVPPPPPAPVPAPAPAAVPAPPAPPAPAAPPAPVKPTRGEAVSAPAPPTPPVPSSPAKVAAPPPPPPPPPAPRIRLEKPGKEGGGTSFNFQQETIIETEEPASHNNSFVWRSTDDRNATAAVWVSSDDVVLDDQVVVVRVSEDEILHGEAQNVVVELINDQNGKKAKIRTNNVVLADDSAYQSGRSASFYRKTDGNQRSVNNQWRRDMEKSLLADQLLEPGESYNVEISGDRLLINGKQQSKEKHARYLSLLQQSLGQPLDGDALYFFNMNSNRRLE